MIPNLEFKKQEFGDERNIYINDRLVPGVTVRGSLRHDEWMLWEPTVLEGTKNGKKYYFITRAVPNYYDELSEGALGAVVFNIMGYNTIIPDWADSDTKFAGIPLQALKDLDAVDIRHMFQSEEDWEDAFQELIEDCDPEEDAEYIANQRADFFSSVENLHKQDPDSYVFLDLYEHSGQVWRAHGCGRQCRWDTTSAAAVLLLDKYSTKLYKEDPDKFWKVFDWYMRRMGGAERTMFMEAVCIDADTYEIVEDEMLDYCYNIDALFMDVDDERNKQEISDALKDITGASDLRMAENVKFKEREVICL